MMKNITLFCLPYAGGSRYSYSSFEQGSASFINLVTLEYPGRGLRAREPLLTHCQSIADDVYQRIKAVVDQQPYALYGHSMGGLIGYLVIQQLISRHHRQPVHFFITGTPAPAAASRQQKKTHLLERAAFIEEIKKFNGSPPEILDDDELLDYFEPILRADFTATETYIHQHAPPAAVPFTVITGTGEDILPEEVREWQQESSLPVDFRQMDGDHFFIYKHTRTLLDVIANKLSNSLKPLLYE